MKKNITLALIATSIFIFIFLIYEFVSVDVAIMPASLPLQKISYYPDPGEVANVFGWRYNRSVCRLPHSSDYVLFFYAEDQTLYAIFSSKIGLGPIPITKIGSINPDYDIVCGKNGTFSIAYSDPNQQNLYLAQGTMRKYSVSIIRSETVYTGRVAYTAVAPSLRYHNGLPFIGFMEYGRTGSDFPNSVALIAKKANSKWVISKIMEHPADMTQVIGISLEIVNANLISILAPFPGDMFTSKYNALSQEWSIPEQLHDYSTRGQLEWQTLTDSEDTTHLIYRNDRGQLIYSDISHNTGQLVVEESASTHGFSMFEVDSHGTFILQDNVLTPTSDISKHQIVEELPARNLYFLQVSESASQLIHVWWLDTSDEGQNISHSAIDISKYFPTSSVTTSPSKR